jgi:adsorption protein B
MGQYTIWQWLVLVQHELLLFAGVFFLLCSLDELLVDLIWLCRRLSAGLRNRMAPEPQPELLADVDAAVFIAAWQEAGIIGVTVRHLLDAWPQPGLRVYVGCYANDLATLVAASDAAVGDTRLRLVAHSASGPTTKADCLNRLYRALEHDEARQGHRVRMIVLHDAEDMVDPLAIGLLDREIGNADMVQLPVLPVPQPNSRWIGSHYCEEFAEAHGRAMVVRDAIGAGVPLAGVGCGLARETIARLAVVNGGAPFAPDCLTEDYELGIGIAAIGGTSRFLRVRAPDGRLIATRAFFPARIRDAVRQKTRWMHGIAFQGWDRLGWRAHPADFWMRVRDRRGPFVALVLAIAYVLLLLVAISAAASLMGLAEPMRFTPLVEVVLAANLASLVWRAAMRFAFTAREYGWLEGLRAIARIPVANIIAIMAGRRALLSYVAALRGAPLRWDRTTHDAHPAALPAGRPAA